MSNQDLLAAVEKYAQARFEQGYLADAPAQEPYQSWKTAAEFWQRIIRGQLEGKKP